MTPEELQELRDWAARKMGWTLQLHQFGCVQGNVRMSWVSIKNGELSREFLQEEWLPDRPESGQIWMVVERMRELGFHLILHNKGKEWIANFPNHYRSDLKYKRDHNPCLAILKAARATED